MSRWREWHLPYENPDSELSRRLRVVQSMIRDALDAARPGALQAIQFCAGQGRDVIGALSDHPRRDDVRARLVELDPELAEDARRAAGVQGLTGLQIVTGDASVSTAYEGAVPADLVLLCGVFGNISDDDVRKTIEFLPSLCALGATVVWTRSRRPPDLTVDIRRWFGEASFEEVAFVGPSDAIFGVGSHRFHGDPKPFETGVRLFTFLR